jgi:hypothetical protein
MGTPLRIKLLGVMTLVACGLAVSSLPSLGARAADAAVIVNIGSSNCGYDDHGWSASSSTVQYHTYYQWADNGLGGCYIVWGHQDYYYLSGGTWHYWGTYMMMAGDPVWRWYPAR